MSSEYTQKATILVVDDDIDNLNVKVVESGGNGKPAGQVFYGESHNGRDAIDEEFERV